MLGELAEDFAFPRAGSAARAVGVDLGLDDAADAVHCATGGGAGGAALGVGLEERVVLVLGVVAPGLGE